MNGLEKLHLGMFNYLTREEGRGAWDTYMLWKRDEGYKHIMRIRDLNGPKEKLLEDTIVEIK